MRVHGRWCLLLLAGCGRIDFDATFDTGSCSDGHNEDGDALDDGCDNCPHLPNNDQADGDRDGVGDVCDPNPTTPGDRIIMFETFETLGPWDYADMQPTLSNDSLTADTTARQMIAVGAGLLGNERFEIGGHLFDGPSTVQHQIIVFAAVGSGKPPLYYCELDSTTPAEASLGLTYTFDNSTYTVVASGPETPPLVNGDFRLAIDHRPPSATCRTTWPPMFEATGALPTFTPTTYGFAVQGVVMRLDWAIRIAMP